VTDIRGVERGGGKGEGGKRNANGEASDRIVPVRISHAGQQEFTLRPFEKRSFQSVKVLGCWAPRSRRRQNSVLSEIEAAARVSVNAQFNGNAHRYRLASRTVNKSSLLAALSRGSSWGSSPSRALWMPLNRSRGKRYRYKCRSINFHSIRSFNLLLSRGIPDERQSVPWSGQFAIDESHRGDQITRSDRIKSLRRLFELSRADLHFRDN